MNKQWYITVIGLFLHLTSIGCSCDSIPYLNAIERADEIFIGRINEIKRFDFTYKAEVLSGFCVTFDVEKKWKGSSRRQVKVCQTGTSCDFPFDVSNGERYLVYAHQDNIFKYYENQESRIELTTWLCSRTDTEASYLGYLDGSWDDKGRLDKSFPATIELKEDKYIYWIIVTVLAGFLISLIVWKMKK